jgi:hypothetical protein
MAFLARHRFLPSNQRIVPVLFEEGNRLKFRTAVIASAELDGSTIFFVVSL